MLFNSIDFLVFFCGVAAIYPFLYRRPKPRNAVLLVASYVFYGWWDPRFLALLALSTVIDFTIAQLLDATKDERRRLYLVTTSIVLNLSILGYFKYANFFLDSTVRVLDHFGVQADFATLNIILPLGISFYTFQTLSYTLDVYRHRLAPTTSLLDFALYVSFFPQMVAGPIERANSLLPQISLPVTYKSTDFSVAIWLILFGYFKKVFVADNLGASIDPIFASHAQFTLADSLLAVVAFSVQIYGDFSGYSDIARGVARLLGFHLMVNFRCPYFACSPSEFWQRWHISLSTWLRDYLYIPLGGNRGSDLFTARNLMLTMLLGGLWHGASIKFVVWGALHGTLLILERRGVVFKWAGTLVMILIGWLIFRAPSLTVAYSMLVDTEWNWTGHTTRLALKIVFYASPLLAMDLWMERNGDLLVATKLTWWCQTLLYSAFVAAIVILGFDGASEFIYFQF